MKRSWSSKYTESRAPQNVSVSECAQSLCADSESVCLGEIQDPTEFWVVPPVQGWLFQKQEPEGQVAVLRDAIQDQASTEQFFFFFFRLQCVFLTHKPESLLKTSIQS